MEEGGCVQGGNYVRTRTGIVEIEILLHETSQIFLNSLELFSFFIVLCKKTIRMKFYVPIFSSQPVHKTSFFHKTSSPVNEVSTDSVK